MHGREQTRAQLVEDVAPCASRRIRRSWITARTITHGSVLGIE